MNLYDRLLSFAPADKVQHFLAGAVLAVVGAALALAFLGTPSGVFLGATLAALLVGVAKEVLDAWDNVLAARAGEAPRHGVELMDTITTMLGGMYVGALLAAGIMVAAHV